MSRSDKLVGIGLGIVLALVILVVLVFVVGDDVDAPSLDRPAGGGQSGDAKPMGYSTR